MKFNSICKKKKFLPDTRNSCKIKFVALKVISEKFLLFKEAKYLKTHKYLFT